MAYLLDYVGAQRSPFETVPFNPVDAAALTQITMIKAGKVVPALLECADFTDESHVLEQSLNPDSALKPLPAMLDESHFDEMFGGSSHGGQLKDNLSKMAANPRFSTVAVGGYLSILDVKSVVQFAAMSFSYKDQWSVVCFRGTDSTLTGWKEDCDMAYKAPVPAQSQAVRYLEAAADRLKGKLMVVGHSKGGNLAEYAVAKCRQEIQSRIFKTYNLDGPGFKQGVISDKEYSPIIDRIYKICPLDSIVGILLYSPVPIHVVPSSASGAAEHDPFTWAVDASSKSDFVHLTKLSDNSLMLQQILRTWLTQYDDKKREELVESIFNVIQRSGGKNINDVFGAGLSGTADALRKVSATDGKDVSNIVEAGQSLFNIAANLVIDKLDRESKES